MKITIKEIAKHAEVSIATVSHVFNKTRYVSPELTKRVLGIALDLGYFKEEKKGKETVGYYTGKLSEIALVIPNVMSVASSQLITNLTRLTKDNGYLLSVYLTDEKDKEEERILTELLSNRRIAGIIISPTKTEGKIYKKLACSMLPFVCIEQLVNLKDISGVVTDHSQGAELGTKHLIRNGHEKILLLLEENITNAMVKQREGYVKAYREAGLSYKKEWIVGIEQGGYDKTEENIRKIIEKCNPTAIFACENIITLKCLKALQNMAMEYPKDISVVGFGDGEWTTLTKLPITVLLPDTMKIAQEAMSILLHQIKSGKEPNHLIKKVPMKLIIKKSTQILAKGPTGERVIYPEDILLSKEEEDIIRKRNYTVGISLHYTGTEWTRLHEKAIRNTLENLGVEVLAVKDAHFDWKIQNAQLESLLVQNPDAIIAVPTDEKYTASTFRKISKKTRLIFINGMPVGFKEKDYNFWVSVNELENGGNAAKILGNHFKGRQAKIGMLIHGASFFATRQRDFWAEKLLERHYPNLHIIAKDMFIKEDNVSEVCCKMLNLYPDIEGLYVTWDRPALKVLEFLRRRKRADVVVATTDLDYDIASYMSRNEMVIGLSSQRPYEQGVAVAIATARALLDKNAHACVGVSPYMVIPENLEKAWNEILKSKLPKF